MMWLGPPLESVTLRVSPRELHFKLGIRSDHEAQGIL